MKEITQSFLTAVGMFLVFGGFTCFGATRDSPREDKGFWFLLGFGLLILGCAMWYTGLRLLHWSKKRDR